jgi:hypothetical protein
MIEKTVTAVINQNLIIRTMKSIVKNITALMIVVISFTSAEFVNANSATADTLKTTPVEQTAQDDRMEEALLFGLQSDVSGILEATFYNTVAYKTLNPEFSSERVVEKITEIALDENDHVVRYKAFLTLSYLKDFNEYSKDLAQLRSYVQSNDSLSAYQLILDNLEQQQLASKR